MFVHERLDPNQEFRERRERDRRRRRRQRTALLAVLLLAGAAAPIGVFVLGGDGSQAASTAPGAGTAAPVTAGGTTTAAATTAAATTAPAPPPLAPLPKEIRGVHVTMALASVPGRLGTYFAMREHGLNTLQLDVKDESGEVGFSSPYAPAAQEIGAVRPYYDPEEVARTAEGLGIYLIGRVVVFEDPVLSAARPEHALRTPDGRQWKTSGGQGWVSQYDPKVWDYAVDVAESAARAGFDEIQFDYVRFPSDGDLASIVYPGKRAEAKAVTIRRFLEYAIKRLRPLGVRVSADLFGLAATHELHIGQSPRAIGRIVDAIYPMVYPSHYNPGEFNLADPESSPGETVGLSLADFRRAVGRGRARIVPWIQDFSLGRTYTLFEVRQQIDAARAAGAAGFLLWNPRGVYTTEALRP